MTERDPRFVALGSNVGDRVGYLFAQRSSSRNSADPCCFSSHAYETEPAYGIATPVVNAVAEIRTELHPHVLMELLEVENALNRTRARKARRAMDLALSTAISVG